MKKILFLIVLAIACYMLFSGCSRKEQGTPLQVPGSKKAYMSGFEKLVAQEKKDGYVYNDEEWKMMNRCFCIYVEDYKAIYINELNQKDLNEIDSLISAYLYVYHNALVNSD